LGAVQDEVKLIFCPPGDFHHDRHVPCKTATTGKAVNVAVSTSKASTNEECLEQPDIALRKECIKELLIGNFE
jgi:hypothetical protein